MSILGKKWFYISLVFVLAQCRSNKSLYSRSTFTTDEIVNYIVEIPAGTNQKIEYDPSAKQFKVDRINGKKRIINFLPYPGNYGFIPSTFSNPLNGGDGDALDALLLSEALKTGTVIEVRPIAIFKLLDKGEKDYKIICVPVDKTQRTINVSSFEQLKLNYPKALAIVETWFLNYDKNDKLESRGWGDEKEALSEIRNSAKN